MPRPRSIRSLWTLVAALEARVPGADDAGLQVTVYLPYKDRNCRPPGVYVKSRRLTEVIYEVGRRGGPADARW